MHSTTRRNRWTSIRTIFCIAAVLTAGLTARAVQTPTGNTQRLRIVVIAGEAAVNIIQQKTAVAPVVEVRDRNDQPVAGAVVTFAIKGGRATFSGARTLSVTTNGAGRAATSGLTPTGSGAFQIGASAAFEGQTAVATIAQTNVMTAAEAAGAGGAGGAGGGGTAAGAGAAGGGGLSLTTIAIVGGAVAGGTLVATKVLRTNGGITTYKGPFRIEAVQLNHQTQGNGIVNLTCTAAMVYTGILTAEIEEREDGSVTGGIFSQNNATELSRTCPFTSASSDTARLRSDVTGTAGNLQSSIQQTSPDGVGFSSQSFSGALNGGVITGTLALSYRYRTIPLADGFFSDGTFPETGTLVTLQKQ